jgi:hypothetical protein
MKKRDSLSSLFFLNSPLPLFCFFGGLRKKKKGQKKSRTKPHHKMYTAAKHAAVTSISSSSSYSSSSSSSSSLKLGLTAPKTLVVKFGGRRSVAKKIVKVIVPNGAFEDGMMQLTSDDVFVQACAPWGNLCVSWGTKYVPIGVPSILASLLLFVPLFVALAKIRELEKENFHLKEEMTTKKR